MLAAICPAADEIVQFCGCTSFSGEWYDPNCPLGHNHTGVDLGSTMGGWSIFRSPVYASRSGYVVVVGMPYLGEQAVGIRGDDGLFYGYGHLDIAVVSVGQWVAEGQLIGLMGTRGNSEAPHLHFFVRRDGCWDGPPFENVVDPTPYLSFTTVRPIAKVVVPEELPMIRDKSFSPGEQVDFPGCHNGPVDDKTSRTTIYVTSRSGQGEAHIFLNDDFTGRELAHVYGSLGRNGRPLFYDTCGGVGQSGIDLEPGKPGGLAIVLPGTEYAHPTADFTVRVTVPDGDSKDVVTVTVVERQRAAS